MQSQGRQLPPLCGFFVPLLLRPQLRPDEAFFSIDGFGPFAVKMKPGLALRAPDGQRVVPQWQKSHGCLIMTAALELSSNQVTRVYGPSGRTASRSIWHWRWMRGGTGQNRSACQ